MDDIICYFLETIRDDGEVIGRVFSGKKVFLTVSGA